VGKKYIENHRLLLLGTGDSGKSTFLRHIKHIHGGGLEDEGEKFKEVIKRNCFDSIRHFLRFAREKDVQLPDKLNGLVDDIISAESLTPGVAKIISKFGNSNEIEVLTQEYDNKLQIPSSSIYFWKEARRIAPSDFTPTKDDIILSKLKTVGIYDIKFVVENILFTMVDVGGQRSERRKWYHCFDSVSAIIYFTAVDEYDGKVLEEDNVTDRFIESLNLFGKLSDFFKKTHHLYCS